jgi:CRISPR/Cas system-associated endonuclease Cas1
MIYVLALTPPYSLSTSVVVCLTERHTYVHVSKQSGEICGRQEVPHNISVVNAVRQRATSERASTQQKKVSTYDERLDA